MLRVCVCGGGGVAMGQLVSELPPASLAVERSEKL
jgi:hypothetical protein